MKIQLAFAAAAALVTSNVFASVAPGTYQGTTLDGQACSIIVTREWHESGLHHGLNHRVQVEAQGLSLTLSHPPVVDKAAGTVRFDHDHLVGTLGVSKAGVGMVLEMDHSPGKDGPTALTVLHDSYVNAAASTRWTCSGLTLVEE